MSESLIQVKNPALNVAIAILIALYAGIHSQNEFINVERHDTFSPSKMSSSGQVLRLLLTIAILVVRVVRFY